LRYDCLETVTPQGDGPHNQEVLSVTSHDIRRRGSEGIRHYAIIGRLCCSHPAEPDIKPAVAGIPGKNGRTGHGIDVS
jgi:hypothetical protein